LAVGSSFTGNIFKVTVPVELLPLPSVTVYSNESKPL
jgi:hypothetical protein